MVVMAIDPGREKCGLAVVFEDGSVPEKSVIATAGLEGEILRSVKKYAPDVIVLGNGTSCDFAEAKIRAAAPSLPVEIIDEYRTTDDAKIAYWKANPPTGWRRFFPTSMQVPPVPVDDFAAVILARRYLNVLRARSIKGSRAN